MQCLYFSVWTLLCINFVSAGISFSRKKSRKYSQDYTLPTPESWASFDYRPLNPSLINDKKSTQIPDPPQNERLLKRLKSTMIHYGSDEDKPADPPKDQSSFSKDTAPASKQETHQKTDRKWINQGLSEETSKHTSASYIDPKKSNQNWAFGVSSDVNPRANPAPPNTYLKMPSLINGKKSTQFPNPPQNEGLIEKLKTKMIQYSSDEDQPAAPLVVSQSPIKEEQHQYKSILKKPSDTFSKDDQPNDPSKKKTSKKVRFQEVVEIIPPADIHSSGEDLV